jgi:hypothetical protein
MDGLSPPSGTPAPRGAPSVSSKPNCWIPPGRPPPRPLEQPLLDARLPALDPDRRLRRQVHDPAVAGLRRAGRDPVGPAGPVRAEAAARRASWVAADSHHLWGAEAARPHRSPRPAAVPPRRLAACSAADGFVIPPSGCPITRHDPPRPAPRTAVIRSSSPASNSAAPLCGPGAAASARPRPHVATAGSRTRTDARSTPPPQTAPGWNAAAHAALCATRG